MAHCKNDQLKIIGLGVQASLIFPKESPRELGCKGVLYRVRVSAIITPIKFLFKRRDNPTVVCALLISSAWY